jgi:hypothetical protein
MANNRRRIMSDVTDDNSKNQQESGEKSELELPNETGGKKYRQSPISSEEQVIWSCSWRLFL